MRVRPKKAPAAHKGETAKPLAQSHLFPAPTRGLVLAGTPAVPDPLSALVLDNFICTTDGIEPRGGTEKHATVTGPVVSLFTYSSGGGRRLFASTVDALFDVTSVPDADVAPAPVVSGLTGGHFSTCQFGTPGGNFLVAVNGADALRLFDGVAWSAIRDTSAPIAITGIGTAKLSAVWTHAKRLWFAEGGSDSAWYLPTNSVGGAAVEFPLRSVFRRGGGLLFGTTWSMDAGDGLDDKCVFVSTEGEIAVFGGTDPASLSTWALEGVYDMPRPLGKNSFVRAGGDVLIATEAGLIPVSSAVQSDVNGQVGISAEIATLWQRRAQESDAEHWEIAKIPNRNVMIVSQPGFDGREGTALCVNLQTRAWSRFTGVDARCITEFAGRAYFGDREGAVHLLDSGGTDNGDVYSCVYVGQFDDLGLGGAEKTLLQARALFKTATPISPKVTALVDYDETLPTLPASPADYAIDVWDAGLWDAATWDAGPSLEVSAAWEAVGKTGAAIAPAVIMTFGVGPTPQAKFTSVLVQYTVGGPVS